jgi:hypothetical protein
VNVCVPVFRKGPLRSVTFTWKNGVIEWTWRKYEGTKVPTILTGKTRGNRLVWFIGLYKYATWGGGRKIAIVVYFKGTGVVRLLVGWGDSAKK